MSRESAEARQVVASIVDMRAPAPADCLPAEADLWRQVVDSKPADWFGRDSLPVLREYVRAVMACDALAVLVNQALEGDSKGLRVLLEMRDRESKRVALLATKLRLTQQSRYTPQAAGTANKKVVGPRPWDRGNAS